MKKICISDKIKKRIAVKLRSKAGESLTETLVSVLVISVTSVALAAMLGAASRMNIQARNYDEKIDTIVNDFYKSPKETPGTIKAAADGTSSSQSFAITLITSDSNDMKLSSYDPAAASPSPSSEPTG